MNVSAMYSAQKKKLQGVCDEHNLVFFLKKGTYPITLTAPHGCRHPDVYVGGR